jgi:hypothetical protein
MEPTHPEPQAPAKAILREVLVHLRAGRWTEAHNLVQSILHIQEGDLEDAEYWYTNAGRNFRNRGSFDEELTELENALQMSH